MSQSRQYPLSHLSEKYVQDSFHSYLKSSLTQAKAERLLDVEVLAKAEGDLMITGTNIEQNNTFSAPKLILVKVPHFVYTLRPCDVRQILRRSLCPVLRNPHNPNQWNYHTKIVHLLSSHFFVYGPILCRLYKPFPLKRSTTLLG